EAKFRRTLSSDLVEAERKVAGLGEDLVKAEQRTKLQGLIAPVDGVVQQLAIHTVGGVVTPAQALAVEPKGHELVYAARISLDRTQMQIDDNLVNLTPGMAVTVEIKTGARTVISYLLSPLMRYKQESLRER